LALIDHHVMDAKAPSLPGIGLALVLHQHGDKETRVCIHRCRISLLVGAIRYVRHCMGDKLSHVRRQVVTAAPGVALIETGVYSGT
jgi:hypothetical protein